jgi:hypothetical protein
MNRQSTVIPEPVLQLQRRLEQFRSTQRTKLPESLWQAAVELARQHGVYPERLGALPTFRAEGSQDGIRGTGCAVNPTSLCRVTSVTSSGSALKLKHSLLHAGEMLFMSYRAQVNRHQMKVHARLAQAHRAEVQGTFVLLDR